jgi:hypothetical protein
VNHRTEALAERHPALLNLALACAGLGVFASLYWLVGLVGGVPR